MRKPLVSPRISKLSVAVISALAVLAGSCSLAGKGEKALTALLVATSYSGEITPGRKTGCWAEELLVPIEVFRRQGIEVTVTTPLGGPVPFDEASLDSGTAKSLLVPVVKSMVEASVPLARVMHGKYDIVYIAGGHGVLWDLTGNEALAEIIRCHLDSGAVVAAVCHGPAALAGIKGSTGVPVVSGLRMTGFSLAEEKAVGLTAEVGATPLGGQLEEVCIRDGAFFEAGAMWAPKVVVSGNLLTGQNPASSRLLALTAANVASRGWYFLDDASPEIGYYQNLSYHQPPRAIMETTPHRSPVTFAALPEGSVKSGPLDISGSDARALMEPAAAFWSAGLSSTGSVIEAGAGVMRFRRAYPEVFDRRFTVMFFFEESPLSRLPWFDYMVEHLLSVNPVVRVSHPVWEFGEGGPWKVRGEPEALNQAQIPFESRVAGITLYVARNSMVSGKADTGDPLVEIPRDLGRSLPGSEGVKVGESVRFGGDSAVQGYGPPGAGQGSGPEAGQGSIPGKRGWTVPGSTRGSVYGALAVAVGEPGKPGYRVIEFCRVP